MLCWRPSRRDGSHDDEIEVRIGADDEGFLRGLWEDAERRKVGPRSPAVAELRTLLDLFALFPGSRFVDPPPEREWAFARDPMQVILQEAEWLAPEAPAPADSQLTLEPLRASV